MWILIRWLHQKPADWDLQCFYKRINLVSAGQGSRCPKHIYPIRSHQIWIKLGSARQGSVCPNVKSKRVCTGYCRKAVWGHSQHAQNKYRKRQIIRKKEGYVDEEDEVDEDEYVFLG